MLLLRVASLVQVCFLPGYLLVRRSGLAAADPLRAALYAFASSLIVNWVLVFALTAAGWYRPAVLYVVFAAESLWFIRLNWGRRITGHVGAALEHLRETSFVYQAALVAAILSSALLAVPFFENRDAIFTDWDAVVSWNRWALDWAANRLPRLAWRYPQLLPANWSVLYVFTRDDVVQAPSRMVQALFPLGIVMVLLEVGIRQRSTRFLVAVPLCAAALCLFPFSLSNGYADIPVTFFGVLAVVTAFYGDQTERDWWLAVFFACGAALTKQAGLYLLVFVWTSALISLKRRRFAVRSAALILALVGSWYLFKEVQIRLGLEQSELYGVTVAAHDGRGFLERVLRVLRYVFGGGIAVWIAMITGVTLVAMSLRDARQRTIVLGLVAPYSVIWLLLYSYDQRNVMIVVPFAVVAAVHGFWWNVAFVPTRLQVTAAAIAALGAVGFAVHDERALRERQLAQQRALGDPALNAALYRHLGEDVTGGKVGTGYQYLGFLPGFRERMVAMPGRLSVASLDTAERDPDIRYLLNPPEWMTQAAWSEVETRIRDGRYRHVFDQPSVYGTVRLVEIK
jgi:hypothetical protein